MSPNEWNDEGQGPPAPLPAHERAWRHPSEIGQRAWVHSEPPLAIGRGLFVATGAVGGLLAMAVLWTMLPTQPGRSAVATVRSTIATRAETVLAASRHNPSTEPVPQTEPTESTAAPTTQSPTPTYQLQSGIDPTSVAVAVAVSGGSLVVTTAHAVAADLTVELMLSDGSTDTARVLFVDDRNGFAVLAPDSVNDIESFVVAGAIAPGDRLTFLGNEPHTVTVAGDGSFDEFWVGDESTHEGAPVVNQRGELVALCSKINNLGRLVQLTNFDELQRAIAGYPAVASVWLGIALNDDPSGELSIAAVDPAGPAAAAGLTSGDVIETVDGIAIVDGDGIIGMLAAHRAGDVLQFVVRRADQGVVAVSVTLGEPRTTL